MTINEGTPGVALGRGERGLVNHGPIDANQVSLADPAELRYWMDQFGTSEVLLAEAVNLVGSAVADVEASLIRLALDTADADPAAPSIRFLDGRDP